MFGRTFPPFLLIYARPKRPIKEIGLWNYYNKTWNLKENLVFGQDIFQNKFADEESLFLRYTAIFIKKTR